MTDSIAPVAEPSRLSVAQNVKFFCEFVSDPPQTFRNWHFQLGDSFWGRLPGYRFLSTTNPALIDHVLRDEAHVFGKGNFAREFEPLWGKVTLQISDDADWRRHRRVFGALFGGATNKRVVSAVAERMSEQLERIATDVTKGAKTGLYFPLRDAMYHGFLDVYFPNTSDADRNALAEYTRTFTDHASRRFLQAASWMNVRNWMDQAAYIGAAKQAHAIADRMLLEAAEAEGDDILAVLGRSAASDDPGSLWQEEARGNVMMLVIACYEFPALGWALHYIGQRPGLRQRIKDEVRAEAAQGLSIAQAPSPLLMKSFEETFRVVPPAPLLARLTMQDTEIDGIRLKRGHVVVIPVFAMHMCARNWDDAAAFNPERGPSDQTPRPYMPFGRGPRGCAAGSVSLSAMKCTMAALLRHYDYHIDENASPDFHDPLKSYPAGGVTASVRADKMRA